MLRKFYKTISLKARVLIIILGIVTLNVLSFGVISYYISKSSLLENAQAQLSSVIVLTKDRLASFITRSENFTEVLAKDRLIEGLFIAYETAYFGNGFSVGKDEKVSTEVFSKLNAKYSPNYSKFLNIFEFENVLLVNTGNQIVFSARDDSHGSFLGKSLSDGIWKDTPLAGCVKEATKDSKSTVHFSGYARLPETQNVTAFTCARVFAEFDYLSDGIKKGDALGVVVAEFNINILNKFISSREGMGTTGQLFLLGADEFLKAELPITTQSITIKKQYEENKPLKGALTEWLTQIKDLKKTQTNNLLGKKAIVVGVPINAFGENWYLAGEKELDEVLASVDKTLFWFALCAFFVGVIALFISIVFSNSVSKNVKSALTDLQSYIEKLSQSSEQLNSNSSQLLDGSQTQLNAVTSSLSNAEAVQETFNTTFDRITQAANLSKKSETDSESGKLIMHKMKETMSKISGSFSGIQTEVKKSQDSLNEFVTIINEIQSKTNIINDIVFQTKLLSFNASVEAARAGESGKGFAVVAEEIGSLAELSGNASKEIFNLITSSKQKVQSVAEEMNLRVNREIEENKKSVTEGEVVSEECLNSLINISSSVKSLSELMGEVSRSSKDQQNRVNEINQSISSIEKETKNNLDLSKSVSDASGTLSDASHGINKSSISLSQFVDGSKAIDESNQEYHVEKNSNETDDENYQSAS